MQIGEIIEDPEKQKEFWWHPHSSEKRRNNNTNVIFKGAETLSFDKSKPGAGLLTFDKKRVLTSEGCSKATWQKNKVYDVNNILSGKSNPKCHRKNSAKDPEKGIYYSGIWQELGLKESDDCTEWAKYIIL